MCLRKVHKIEGVILNSSLIYIQTAFSSMYYNQIEWIDVSLDEIEDMTPPELAKADPEVSHDLYQKRR